MPHPLHLHLFAWREPQNEDWGSGRHTHTPPPPPTFPLPCPYSDEYTFPAETHILSSTLRVEGQEQWQEATHHPTNTHIWEHMHEVGRRFFHTTLEASGAILPPFRIDSIKLTNARKHAQILGVEVQFFGDNLPWTIHSCLPDMRVPAVLVTRQDGDLNHACLDITAVLITQMDFHPLTGFVQLDLGNLLQVEAGRSTARRNHLGSVALVQAEIQEQGHHSHQHSLVELDGDGVRVVAI